MMTIVIGAEAQLQCQYLFRNQVEDVLQKLNETQAHFLFEKEITENIQQSFFIKKKYQLWKLQKLLKEYNDKHEDYDSFELYRFVYKLDRLVKAETLFNLSGSNEVSMAPEDQYVLSEARRQVLYEGLKNSFNFEERKSGFFNKFSFYFSKLFNDKYWRWSYAAIWTPELVGASLPVELAQKIIWDGVPTHRDEVAAYYPLIRTRAGFNQFSKIYHRLVIVSLFTVFPYMIHDYHQQMQKEGSEQAVAMLKPLIQSSEDLKSRDYVKESIDLAVQNYVKLYHDKYPDQKMTEEQLQQVRQAFEKKYRPGT